jgi:molybdopterin synthase catalytic subunit
MDLPMTTEFKICFAPIELQAVYDLADNGAVVVISGMVRNQTEERLVEYLEYQAYEPFKIIRILPFINAFHCP